VLEAALEISIVPDADAALMPLTMFTEPPREVLEPPACMTMSAPWPAALDPAERSTFPADPVVELPD
jgi:hypothetical protein